MQKKSTNDLHAALNDPVQLRSVLLTYTEKVIALEAKVQAQAPKVQFHDSVTEAINCQSVQEAAKVLGTGPNRLFRFLRERKLLVRNNLSYQQHLDAGYFRVVERQYVDGRGESHIYTRTLVTGEGLSYIQRRFQGHPYAQRLGWGPEQVPDMADYQKLIAHIAHRVNCNNSC